MNRPLVSVIVNCYNGEAFLRQAIESVLAQTYENWELVFWDNQSTDRSAEIFKSYSDSRLKYHYAPAHCLLYDSRNQAIAHAKGELLAFLDVDDWWLPEKLARQVVLFDDTEVGLASCNYLVKNEIKGRVWAAFKHPMPSGHVLGDLLRSYSVALLTLMIRRSALPPNESPFDSRYHIIGDFDRVIRQSATWKLARSPEVLAVYRIHGNNETSKRRERHIGELETWQKEMTKIPAIGGEPNFRWVKIHTTYIKTMDALLTGRRREAYGYTMSLPWSREKARLLAAQLLPRTLVAHFKN